MLAAPSDKPVTSPELEAMGQAALSFVQRFDMRRVLGDFEKELRELAAEKPARAKGGK